MKDNIESKITDLYSGIIILFISLIVVFVLSQLQEKEIKNLRINIQEIRQELAEKEYPSTKKVEEFKI